MGCQGCSQAEAEEAPSSHSGSVKSERQQDFVKITAPNQLINCIYSVFAEPCCTYVNYEQYFVYALSVLGGKSLQKVQAGILRIIKSIWPLKRCKTLTDI